MGAIIINGGTPLRGTVEISGSKNAVLPIIAATVLHGGNYELRNCPDITDVRCACAIVEELGGRVTRKGQTLFVDTGTVFRKTVPEHLMKQMRASVLFLGPLLGRFGTAELTMPGGCPLGCRPIDLHLEAVASMGAAVTLREGTICCHGPRLHGCCIELRFPSVGATENAVMAAAACHGTVKIKNAAREPEVCDLIAFLQTMGADTMTRIVYSRSPTQVEAARVAKLAARTASVMARDPRARFRTSRIASRSCSFQPR